MKLKWENQIDEWLLVSGVSESRLGLLSCGNSLAVERIRNGTATVGTLDEVLRYIRTHRAAGKQGAVYFLQAEEGSPIKIGFSLRPDRRLLSNQTSNHGKLRILKSMPASHAHEAYVHSRLMESHIRGEWFSPSKEVLMFMRQHENLLDEFQSKADLDAAQSERFKRFAAKRKNYENAGRPLKQGAMSAVEAERVWRDMTVTVREAQQITGWHRSTLARRWPNVERPNRRRNRAPAEE